MKVLKFFSFKSKLAITVLSVFLLGTGAIITQSFWTTQNGQAESSPIRSLTVFASIIVPTFFLGAIVALTFARKAIVAIEKRDRQIKIEQARLITSIDNLHTGFAMTDKNCNILLINKVLQEFLNLGSQKNAAKVLDDWINYTKLCAGSIKDKFLIGPLVKAMDDQFYQIVISPVVTGKNGQEVLGTVMLVEDITQRIKIDQLKDEFFSMASHELRTPLTAIRGNAQVLDTYFSPKIKDKEFKETVADIFKASIRLINIVNVFLDMSRLEAGRIQFSLTTFDVHSLVDAALKELRPIIKKKGLKYEVVIQNNAQTQVYADRDKTEEILVNLIGNAVKFTNKGGLKITLGPYGSKSGLLKISVKDTGVGIPDKDQRKIFDKFERGKKTADPIGTGTGLGLYISRHLAEGMSGKVFLENSQSGKGTTVTLILPTSQSSLEPTTSQA
jgi:signal transduction histidine kinase